MKHSTRTRRRWLARVALGLTVVAVAVPSAQGMIQSATTVSASSGQVTDGLGRPLDPSAVKSVQETAIAPADVSKFRLATQLDNEPAAPVVAAPVDQPSFDWNDAAVGIGIGIAAALAALVAWMLLTARKPDHFAGT